MTRKFHIQGHRDIGGYGYHYTLWIVKRFKDGSGVSIPVASGTWGDMMWTASAIIEHVL